MADHEDIMELDLTMLSITSPHQIKRKRPYRSSMEDGSAEQSLEEINQLLANVDLSEGTKDILRVMAMDYQALKILNPDTREYAKKQAGLLRAEMLLQRVLSEDEKYAKLSMSHQSLLDKGKILNLGDYHRANLNTFKVTARALVAERNMGKKKAEKEKNPLDNKPWREILAEIDKEESEMKAWRAKPGHGILGKGAMPNQDLIDFLENVAERCTPPWSFDQAKFEMREYQTRNNIAHAGIDELLETAKKANDRHSEHWRTVAQYIIRDRQALQEEDMPLHLAAASGNKEAILESLRIFQLQYFQVLTTKRDDNGVKMPNQVQLKDALFPEADEDDDDEPLLKNQVLSFVPTDGWEQKAKDGFLAAEKELLECEEAFQAAQAGVTEAENGRKQAQENLRVAQKSFKTAMKNFREAVKEQEKNLHLCLNSN
ncbi:uncharacterized protein LY89DRAFT_684655 [Mollisia scopiformis]|uniref:Uncharacterized protein n=1 Tax=Mollisia scopiformis TaxID=149040 RepID=A0A194XBY4_MOLSC|nr:uncharacterized protein LY89DRAFT_684655 [Mollisia scopiformis]KUJ17683.1 hypothetical protein LY89DRAFT_684655 [Mollisia scopiformis]